MLIFLFMLYTWWYAIFINEFNLQNELNQHLDKCCAEMFCHVMALQDKYIYSFQVFFQGFLIQIK